MQAAPAPCSPLHPPPPCACHRPRQFFEREGCRMVEMTCEQHDELAASTQFITHTVGRMLGAMQARVPRRLRARSQPRVLQPPGHAAASRAQQHGALFCRACRADPPRPSPVPPRPRCPPAAGGHPHRHQGLPVAAVPGGQHRQRLVRPLLRPLHVQPGARAGGRPSGGAAVDVLASSRTSRRADSSRCPRLVPRPVAPCPAPALSLPCPRTLPRLLPHHRSTALCPPPPAARPQNSTEQLDRLEKAFDEVKARLLTQVSGVACWLECGRFEWWGRGAPAGAGEAAWLVALACGWLARARLA